MWMPETGAVPITVTSTSHPLNHRESTIKTSAQPLVCKLDLIIQSLQHLLHCYMTASVQDLTQDDANSNGDARLLLVYRDRCSDCR